MNEERFVEEWIDKGLTQGYTENQQQLEDTNFRVKYSCLALCLKQIRQQNTSVDRHLSYLHHLSRFLTLFTISSK